MANGSRSTESFMTKKGATIILTTNITKGLYNGARGEVTMLEEDGPTIHVNGKHIKLERHRFEIFDAEKMPPWPQDTSFQ